MKRDRVTVIESGVHTMKRGKFYCETCRACSNHTSTGDIFPVEAEGQRKVNLAKCAAIPNGDVELKRHLKALYSGALIGTVCQLHDKDRLVHMEWLLAGDPDVERHTYVASNDIVYSLVWVA